MPHEMLSLEAFPFSITNILYDNVSVEVRDQIDF